MFLGRYRGGRCVDCSINVVSIETDATTGGCLSLGCRKSTHRIEIEHQSRPKIQGGLYR